MKKLLVLLVQVALINTLFAQKVKLYGTVTDENDSIMPGVVVALKGDSIGTQTDTAGKYELEINPGTHDVEFSYIGYEKRFFIVTVLDKKEKRMDVKMAAHNKELDIVVVTGTKYEKKLGEEITSTEVIKPQMLQQGNLTMNEGMNLVPGVNMLGKSISIRGGGGFADATSNRVLALLDDMPIISPENGSIIWDMVPVEELAQVEIIKGSSSSFFGSSALDGVMNMITVNPQPQMVNQVIISYGLYDQPTNKTWDWWWRTPVVNKNGKTVTRLNLPMFGGAQFVHSKQYGDFGVVISAAYQQNQNYLQDAPYTIARLGGKLRYIPHKHPHLTLGINFNVFYTSFNDFFVAQGVGSLMYESSAPPPVSSQRTFNIDPYFNYYDDHDNRFSFKFRAFNVVYNSAAAPPYASGDSTNSTQYYLDFTLTHTFRKINMVLTAGTNGFFTTVTGNTYSNPVTGVYESGTRNIKNVAAFIQFEKKFFKNRLILSGGLRAEYAQLADTTVQNQLPVINALNTMFGGKKDIYSPITPLARVGLNYQVAEGTFLRASIGQGFRYPALAEKYIYTLRSGAQVFPNDSLKPENSWTAEVGIKQSLKISKWIAYFDLSGFITRYHNMIEFEYYGNYPSNITPSGIPFQAQNIENAQIPGVELSALANGALFSVPFNFLVGYTYIYPQNLSYSASDPNATPLLKYRVQNTLKADIDVNYKGFIYGVNAFYGSYMKYIDDVGIGALAVVSDFRATHHDGEFVMDMRVGYNYKEKVTFMFIAKNILDTEYMLQPGLVEAPRNYTFQVTYNF